MTYEIKSIIELEELINNREYIDNLTIDVNEDINHLLCNLTHLTFLKFGNYYNQLTNLTFFVNLQYLEFKYEYNQLTDLSNLVNLTYLKFGDDYNQLTDLSNLVNLIHLEFGSNSFFGICNYYNQPTDLTQCKKLETLNNSNIEELDLSKYRKGIFKKKLK